MHHWYHFYCASGDVEFQSQLLKLATCVVCVSFMHTPRMLRKVLMEYGEDGQMQGVVTNTQTGPA